MSMGQGGAANAGPEPVVVAPGAALRWLGLGWREFVKSPGMWVVFTLTYGVVYFAISFVPIVGQLVVLLAAPIMLGGMAIACNASAAGQKVAFEHFFAGLKNNTGQLVMVGAAYLLGVVAIGLLAALVAVATMGPAAWDAFAGAAVPESASAELASVFGVVTVAILVLMIPFYMAMWFVIPLVAVRGVPAMAALRASFKGAARNLAALVALALVSIVLFVVAMIPIGLGMLIVFPVLVCAMYWSARETFPN